ncbi:MAG: hypothetical protein KJ899_04615, partial [Gammaproteobacteria bacterium]|nr:hypothetical protein [Gammaproteobacteria bacterium]
MHQAMIKGFAIAARAVALTMALVAVAMAAPAAKKDAPDFNHMTTGYPLTGAHAAAACETCHVGGVFRGTPKDCDGCHATGRRIVATPKSTAHIVTTAACDTCHFNTVSFLGARFNHGAAKPGQCTSCHNGRQSRAKAANHNAGLKLTEPCDKCHRTYAWVPATWNHSGAGNCDAAGCHRQNDNQYFRSPTTHATSGMLTYACTDCHNYFAWTPGKYKHNTAATCSSCHSAAAIVKSDNRKPASHTATAIKGINECNDCHSTQGWLPATYRHTGAGTCSSCHDGVKAQGKGATHGYTTAECNTCHTGTTTW